MSINYETTTKELLESVNELLKDMRSDSGSVELSKVVTFKVGILPVLVVYPAIALLPNVERYDNFISGGNYDVTREFQIEGFVKGLNVNEAQTKATKLGEEIREGLLQRLEIINKDDRQRPLSFYYQVGSLSLAGESSFEDFVIGKFILPLTFKSKAIISSKRVAYSTYTQSDDDEIFDKLVSLVTSMRGEYYRKVASIYNTTLPVITYIKLPAIFIEEDSSNILRYEAGRDTIVRSFTISVYTRALPKTQLLWDNIEIVEGLREALLIHYRLEGLIKRLIVRETNYSLSMVENNSYFYKTSLSFDCECYRKAVFV